VNAKETQSEVDAALRGLAARGVQRELFNHCTHWRNKEDTLLSKALEKMLKNFPSKGKFKRT
jgi:hypothetical protein